MMNKIQELISEGALIGFWDARSPTPFKDLSGNQNNGVPTDISIVNGNYVNTSSNSKIVVKNNDSLDLTNFSVIMYKETGFLKNCDQQRLISKRDAGGAVFDIYLNGSNAISVYDGSSITAATIDYIGSKCLGVSVTSGSKFTSYVDGVNTSLSNVAVNITSYDADLILNSYFIAGFNIDGGMTSYLLFNKVLSDSEHAEITKELIKTKFAKDVIITKQPKNIDNSLVFKPKLSLINNDSYDESGNLGVLTNYNKSVIQSKTLFGDTLNFNRDDLNYLFSENSLDLSSTNQFTFHCWVRPGNTGVANKWLFNNLKHTPSPTLGFNIGFALNSLSVYYGTGTVTYLSTNFTGLNFDDDEWKNIILTYESGNLSLYINGEFVGSKDVDITFGEVRCEIGRWASTYVGTNSYYYEGDVAQLELYNTKKSSDWVTERYLAGCPNTSFSKAISSGEEIVTSGEVGNSGWEVQTGGFKLVNSSIDGNVYDTELLSDGDMEKVGIADWVVVGDAVVTKESSSPHGGSQVIRIKNGTTTGRITQPVLTTGKKYKVSGYARGDGTIYPWISLNSGLNVWQGTTSTEWQSFNFEITADSTNIWFRSSSISGNYVDFDDISVKEINPNTKILECTSTGVISLPTSKLKVNQLQASSGTWEFIIKFASIGGQQIIFIGDTPGSYTINHGYMIYFFPDGSAGLLRCNKPSSTGLITTSAGLIEANTQYIFKITRSVTGEFELFIDGVSYGTHTDTTYNYNSVISYYYISKDQLVLKHFTDDSKTFQYSVGVKD